MVDEESFPRGKPKYFPKGQQKRQRYKEKEDQTEHLFTEKKKIKKTEKKEEQHPVKKREPKESDVLRDHQVRNESEFLESGERITVEYLHHKKIQEGMHLLGMIKEIHELELVISLPHCNTGYVQATRISSVYTKLIQKHLSDDSDDDNLTPLSHMFRVGQLMVCSVQSATASSIQLTLEPTVINKYLTSSSLFIGQVVVGAVNSEEDHGFTIDIGKPRFSSFLPSKDVGNAQIRPGSVARFVVTAVRGEGSILILSLDEKKLSKSLVKKEHGISLDSLQPGMCALFNPKSFSKGGISGTFLDFNASLCVLDNNMTNVSMQIENGSDDNFGKKSKKEKTIDKQEAVADKYKEDEEDKDLSNKKKKQGNLVKACVLFVNPMSKHVCVSSSNFMLNSEVRKTTHLNYEESFPIGYKCEAKITKFVRGLGAMLKIEEGRDVVGFCPSKHLSDDKLEDLYNIFTPGKSVSACVVHSVTLDGVVILSLRKSIVDCEFLTYDSVVPGMIVDCKIKSIQEQGLFVSLGKNNYSPVKGMVMNIHMADINLTRPEKKFTVGDIIACKVLSVDKVRKRVRLTHKRTMVKSKFPTVTGYEQFKVGDIVHGYIASIKRFGVFVNFYNNVFGLVPNAELSTDFVENPDQVYLVGQVMRCRVVKLDMQTEQVTLSFILRAGAKKNITSPLCNKIVNVELVKKKEKGFEVLIVAEEKSKKQWSSAFLSTMHLSDFPSLANAWYSSLTVGSVLTGCMVLGKKRPYHVTKKQSIIDECQKRELTFSDLKQDLIVKGFIRHVVPYGVFVHLPGDLVGLCPKSKMADRYLISSEGHFQEGQSVIANVVEVDQEKKRFIVSLQISDCSEQMVDQDILLNNYLNEEAELKRVIDGAWFDAHSVGSHVTAHATGMKQDDGSDECNIDGLPDGVTAKLIDIEDDVEVQGDMKVTILYTNLLKKEILLSGDPKLLNSKTKKKGAKCRTVSGKVMHINEDVSILTATNGNILDVGLALTRNHPNHPLFEDSWPWKNGDELQFKFLVEGQFGVPLFSPLTENKDNVAGKRRGSRNRSDSEASDSTASIAVSFGNLHVGQEVEGVISSVKKTSLLVRITESETDGYKGQPVTGRLHISEMQEELAPGMISMKKYKPWSKIKCKVIGFRDVRTHNFLVITKRTASRCVLELSQRSVHDQLTLIDYDIGDFVTAFSSEYKNYQLHVEVSPSIHGTVPILLLSDNPTATLKSTKPKKKSSAFKCVVVKKYEHTLSLAGDGAMVNKETGKNIFEFQKECITNGRIRHINADNVVVSLPYRATGKLHIANTADEFQDQPFKELKIDDIIRCAVIQCPSDQSLVLSTRKSHMVPEGSSASVVDKEIINGSDLHVGDFVRGFVKNCSAVGLFVILSPTITGRVEMKKISKYFFKDTDILKEVLPPGKLVKCKIIGISQIENKVSLSLLECDTGCPDLVPEALSLPLRHGKEKETKRKAVGPLVDKYMSGSKKLKIELKKKSGTKKKAEMFEDADSGLDEGPDSGENFVKTPTPGNIEIVSHEEAGSDEHDPGFIWDVPNTKKSQISAKNSFDSDDDDDSDAEKDKKDPKKKTRRELEREKELEEADLRKKEELLCGDNLPQTAVEWERLVLTNPQNSMLWVRYMAFHLHATEVDKARVVAEQALKTINFREEQEKLNVWVALLNLENMFGAEDSLDNVMERALQQNDPLKVQTRLASIFENSGKHEQAEEVYEKMFRKYRRNKDVPIMYMTHLMQQGKRETANDIMKRTLQSLEQKYHLEIISKYGQLEYKYGDPEQGRIVFENALSNYPKRSDIWSIYIDMLIKVHKLDEARNVFERVTTMNLSTKKMKTFFKRFIEFEIKSGTEESVAEVRQKAMDFVESKMSNNQME